MKAGPQEELVPGAVVLGLKFLILCEVTAFHGARCSGAPEAQLQLTQTSRGSVQVHVSLQIMKCCYIHARKNKGLLLLSSK